MLITKTKYTDYLTRPTIYDDTYTKYLEQKVNNYLPKKPSKEYSIIKRRNTTLEEVLGIVRSVEYEYNKVYRGSNPSY